MTCTQGRDARRARAIIAGAVIVAAYVAVALAPASLLGTTVRRPVLDDGGGPAVPYNWVDPPKALASTNKPPSSISAKVPLGPGGSKAQAVSTSDVQMTLVITQGMIVASPGAHAPAASVKMVPLAPKGFPAAPSGLELVGNVYQVQGAYLPSGKPLGDFAQPGKAILIYPQLATTHSTGHKLLYSPNGKSWQALETQDIVGLVQAEASIPGPGYVAVAAVPGNTPTSTTNVGGGGGNTLRIAIAVVLGCIALVGIGFLIRLIGKKE